jgi:hypothetical protein
MMVGVCIWISLTGPKLETQLLELLEAHGCEEGCESNDYSSCKLFIKPWLFGLTVPEIMLFFS